MEPPCPRPKQLSGFVVRYVKAGHVGEERDHLDEAGTVPQSIVALAEGPKYRS